MTFRTVLVSPRQRQELVAFVAAHPGRTAAELKAEADTATMRLLVQDAMADIRQRYLVRVDEAGRIWPA
ncbi:hypothetical protein [Streptomyces sp. NPDC001537]